jgi:hypothetical protein
MDLSKIKNRLESLQQKPGAKKEKIDYTKVFWKPKVGKHQIRIVPSKFDKANPFKEAFVHYGFAKFPIFALTNWGEPDPIVEFTKKLRSTSDKDNWSLAKKLDPKMRIYAPVIVRGEEDMGVRLWEFGKEIYMQLLGIAEDEDYGDYTDITEGRDFNIEAAEADIAGRKGIKCTLRVKPKTTPVSTDSKLVETWLEEQPEILELNKKHTYEEIKVILQNWLNPEEAEEDDTITLAAPAPVADDLPWKDEDDSATSKATEKKLGAKKAKTSEKFDALFTED